MAELRPYEQTWRDRLASMLLGDGRASLGAQQFVEGLLGSRGLGTTGMGLVDLTPAGIPMAAQEAQRDVNAGNYVGGILGATAVLPAAKVAAIPAKIAANEVARTIPQNLDELRLLMSQKYPDVKLDISGKESGPVVINRIVVPEDQRGKGIGSSVMNDILNYADQQGKVAALTPDSSFGTSKGKLIDWYSSMGFKMNKGRSRDNSISELMMRLPKQGGE